MIQLWTWHANKYCLFVTFVGKHKHWYLGGKTVFIVCIASKPYTFETTWLLVYWQQFSLFMLPLLTQYIKCITTYDLIKKLAIFSPLSCFHQHNTIYRLTLSLQSPMIHISHNEYFLRQVTATIYYWIYVQTLKMMHCREVWYYSCIILLHSYHSTSSVSHQNTNWL